MANIFHSLFWRLSLFFLISLMFFASIYTYITYKSSLEYSEETSQNLNRTLANSIAKNTKPFLNGKLNEIEIETLFHNVMVINPSVEVYLLDNEGNILSFYAPSSEVKLQKVDLKPINAFIENERAFVKGEDPRNPGLMKVFSAAKIMDQQENHEGYVYVILASEEFTSAADMLEGSFRLKLAVKSIIITLISTVLIGIVIIWYLTRNLKKITITVNDFKGGNLDARINLKARGELSTLAGNIDSMADTIVNYINKIKSMEKLRGELIANVSHDLRTPLTSIQGYAETLVMLDDTLDKEEKLKYTNIILSSTEKVKKLVEDLFEITKLESNQVKLKLTSFSVNEMISDIVAKFELVTESKSLTVILDIPQEEIMINADYALIDRVFQNLFDNAVKNTNEGGEIKISLIKEEKWVNVIIQDTGMGIPGEELPFIFDRYKKAKGNGQEGSGLGLAIVKKILELHQTTIKVNSIRHEGTTFYFSLPKAN